MTDSRISQVKVTVAKMYIFLSCRRTLLGYCRHDSDSFSIVIFVILLLVNFCVTCYNVATT